MRSRNREIRMTFSGWTAVYAFALLGDSWVEVKKLTAPDIAADDLFGRSVSLSGETAFAGAPQTDCAPNADCGAAYVLRPVPRSGDINEDGATDLLDHSFYAFCETGPGGDPIAACDSADIDLDSDVDLFDWGLFQLACMQR